MLGLLFSLLGDIFLVLKNEKFVEGLLSFLIAHLFYTFAVLNDSQFQFTSYIFVVSFLYYLIFSKLLFNKSGSKKYYVLIYGLVITSLLWQSFERAYFIGNEITIRFAAGILLFIISDSVLAYNKFVRKFNLAQLVILSTYYTAQLLIALSI